MSYFDTLTIIYDKYYFLNINSEKARSIELREQAKRLVRNTRRECRKYIACNTILLNWLIERCDTDYKEEIIIKDFFSYDYFLINLGEFISTIESIK